MRTIFGVSIIERKFCRKCWKRIPLGTTEAVVEIGRDSPKGKWYCNPEHYQQSQPKTGLTEILEEAGKAGSQSI